MSESKVAAAQRSLAGSLKAVMTQFVRLLEEEDPAFLLSSGGSVAAAVEGWRKAILQQVEGVSEQRAKMLEFEKLKLMGKVAEQEKELNDARERNAELLRQIVKLNKREQEFKRDILRAQLEGKGAKEDAKKLDLEVRSLRRKLRDLEGGPALTPAEAAPQSLEEKPDIEALVDEALAKELSEDVEVAEGVIPVEDVSGKETELISAKDKLAALFSKGPFGSASTEGKESAPSSNVGRNTPKTKEDALNQAALIFKVSEEPKPEARAASSVVSSMSSPSRTMTREVSSTGSGSPPKLKRTNKSLLPKEPGAIETPAPTTTPYEKVAVVAEAPSRNRRRGRGYRGRAGRNEVLSAPHAKPMTTMISPPALEKSSVTPRPVEPMKQPSVKLDVPAPSAVKSSEPVSLPTVPAPSVIPPTAKSDAEALEPKRTSSTKTPKPKASKSKVVKASESKLVDVKTAEPKTAATASEAKTKKSSVRTAEAPAKKKPAPKKASAAKSTKKSASTTDEKPTKRPVSVKRKPETRKN